MRNPGKPKQPVRVAAVVEPKKAVTPPAKFLSIVEKPKATPIKTPVKEVEMSSASKVAKEKRKAEEARAKAAKDVAKQERKASQTATRQEHKAANIAATAGAISSVTDTLGDVAGKLGFDAGAILGGDEEMADADGPTAGLDTIPAATVSATDGIMDTIKNNPIPALAIGGGLLYLANKMMR